MQFTPAKVGAGMTNFFIGGILLYLMSIFI